MGKAKTYDINIMLNGVESGVFEDYCTKVGCTYAGGIICLIREFLMNGNQESDRLVMSKDYEERISILEDRDNTALKTMQCLVEKVERLQEEVSYLEDEIASLRER